MYFNNFRSIFDDHKLNFVKQMLKKNGLSNNWVDTLIALSDLVIAELSPDLSKDTENMSICQYVISLNYIIIKNELKLIQFIFELSIKLNLNYKIVFMN